MGTMRRLKESLEALVERGDRLTGGALSVLQDALQHFARARAPEAAAAMAYYALLSLFPLMLVLVAVSSFFLGREQVQREAISLITQALPISEELIARNIQQVLRLRGTVGIAGLLGALWSATGVFTVLVRHINLAWSDAELRSFLEKRLVGLVVVTTLAVLLVLSLLSSAAFDLLAQFQVPLAGGVAIYETPLWDLLSALVPALATFLMFLAFYRWVPNTRVRWRAACWGALVATLGWRVAIEGFTCYIRTGLVDFELVYGSLAIVVVLLVWIYLTGLIALLGAHVGAAVDRRVKSSESGP
jgi:membrane protein